MNEFLEKTYYGNTVMEWLVTFLIIAGAFFVSKIMYWALSRIVRGLTKKTKTKFDDIVVDMVEEPAVFIVTVLGILYALLRLNTSDSVRVWIQAGATMLITLAVAWLLARLLDAIYENYLVPIVEASDNKLDDQLLPILRRMTRIIVWSVGIIVALNNSGYDVGALIAGLGIGGLALAMAAKDTVSNFFGGFTIFIDKPFTLHERIKVGGFDGTVVEIGMRSTRLKTLEGRIVTIPNAKFADSSVENVTAEPSRKVVLNLGLTYDTSPSKIREAMETLREIAGKQEALDENVVIAMSGFGDFSLNILFIYYILKEADIMATQTAVNLEILEEFNHRQLEFAFPTQTIYRIEQAS